MGRGDSAIMDSIGAAPEHANSFVHREFAGYSPAVDQTSEPQEVRATACDPLEL